MLLRSVCLLVPGLTPLISSRSPLLRPSRSSAASMRDWPPVKDDDGIGGIDCAGLAHARNALGKQCKADQEGCQCSTRQPDPASATGSTARSPVPPPDRLFVNFVWCAVKCRIPFDCVLRLIKDCGSEQADCCLIHKNLASIRLKTARVIPGLERSSPLRWRRTVSRGCFCREEARR